MEQGSITIIITVWKREYLAQQLASLTTQTVLPRSIWILQNEDHVDIGRVVQKYTHVFPPIYTVRSEFNQKYFGRFSMCNLVETEYVFVIDDDVIPSVNWLEICLKKCRQYKAVISCTGRLIKPFNFRPEAWQGDERKRYFIADNQRDGECNFLAADTQVDYGCNSYFFRAEWIRYFWSIWPATFLSGEDIHLSASLMITQSIPTIVPRQSTDAECGNLKKSYSLDEVSSWRDSNFLNVRQQVFEFFIKEKKWEPLLWRGAMSACVDQKNISANGFHSE